MFNSDEDLQVDGSCEVKPSQSWCIMSPEMFNFVASVSTLCSARVTDGDGEAVTSSESPPWYLCDVGKGRRRLTFVVSLEPMRSERLSAVQ